MPCTRTVSTCSQTADIPRLVLCDMFLGGALPALTATESALCYLWSEWAWPQLGSAPLSLQRTLTARSWRSDSPDCCRATQLDIVHSVCERDGGKVAFTRNVAPACMSLSANETFFLCGFLFCCAHVFSCGTVFVSTILPSFLIRMYCLSCKSAQMHIGSSHFQGFVSYPTLSVI